MRTFSLLFLIFLFLSSPAQADLYKYTDDKGKVHYVSDKDYIPAKYRDSSIKNSDFPEINKSKAPDWKSKISDDSRYVNTTSSSVRSGRNKVNVYVAPNCAYCDRLEAYLKKNKVRYSRHDITSSTEARRAFDKLNGRGTPLTEINGTIIRGFKPDVLDAALGR